MSKRLIVIACLSTSVLAQLLFAAAHAAPSAPTCDGQVATIVGTEGDDNLYGTPANDVIVGLGGNDLLKGYEGDDILCGGAGSDDHYAHEGNDRVFGGADNDSLEGGTGDDYLHLGGTGSFDPEWENELKSGNIACGDCALPGQPDGNDTIIGGPGTDGCMTTGIYKGASWISAGGGNDYIDLKGGDDCASTDGGDDTLLGGAGNDLLFGGSGNDKADGGSGANICLTEIKKSCGKPSKK